MDNVSYLLAFSSGLLSFLSPWSLHFYGSGCRKLFEIFQKVFKTPAGGINLKRTYYDNHGLGILNPVLASMAMAVSSMIVVGNSLRLRRAAEHKLFQ